jgi:tetratricopeptide (TPR) repeat protein
MQRLIIILCLLGGFVGGLPEVVRADVSSEIALADTAYKNGDYEGAIRHYTNAIAIDSVDGARPHTAHLYADRARVYHRMRLYDKAIDDCSKGIALKPDAFIAARLYNGRGNAYGRKGLSDKAIADFSQAIVLSPTWANPYNNRAWELHLAGRNAEGLADANKAIAFAPQDANAIETRAEIYEKLGQKDKALADYRDALLLQPGNKDAKEGLQRLGQTQ